MDYKVALYSGNAVSNAKKAYNLELAEIKDEKNRSNLASILLNRDANESGNISLAFYLARVTDADANADGFRTASAMIEKVTGLKKSMISNYVKVGKFITNKDGMLEIPEYAKGFSVTQLTEILAKKSLKDFEEMVNDGTIDSTMSAKKLRDACKPDAVIDSIGEEIQGNAEQDNAEQGNAEQGNAEQGNETVIAKGVGENDDRMMDFAYIVDSNGNRLATIGFIAYHNGYTRDGIMAMDSVRIELNQ